MVAWLDKGPVFGRNGHYSPLRRQLNRRNGLSGQKSIGVTCAIVLVLLIAIYVRSVVFFTFPYSWLYEHGCASSASRQTRGWDASRADLDLENNAELAGLLKDADAVLALKCVPLSFSRMADHVTTLLDVSRAAEKRAVSPSSTALFLQRLRDELTRQLFPFVTQGFPKQTISDLRSTYTHDRGIVIPVGVTGWRMAAHSIAIIRRVHNCTLPIQVMYAGDKDLPGPARLALRRIAPGVELIDILDFFDESIVDLRHGGWAIKPFAMLASNFKQVLLADADAVFLQSPDVFFQGSGYRQTGTWFFHDLDWHPHPFTRHWSRGRSWLRQVLSGRKASQLSPRMQSSPWLSGQSEHEAESGVVMFDKARLDVLIDLLFVCWMNTAKVRKVTYHYTWGDKESFWLPFELTHVPYHFEQAYAAGIGNIVGGRLYGHPLHIDGAGAPLWHNKAMWKEKTEHQYGWLNAQVWIDNTNGFNWDSDLWMHGFANEQVHKLDGTPLGKRLHRMMEVAEETETNWAFVHV